MKCGKSSKTKKSRSCPGSLGTVPGCRAASSATIRALAEPTWCTCSSALGRPAMNSRLITPEVCQPLNLMFGSAETAGRRLLLGHPAQRQQQRLRQHRAEHDVADGLGGRPGRYRRQLVRRDLL